FWFFLQLSLQNHFYWAEQSFEKIYGWLPDDHKPYFRLLFQLWRFTYLELEQGGRCAVVKMLAHHQAVSFGRLQIAYHRFGKSIFSVFSDIFQDLKVKLDKQVQWHFEPKQNLLTIQPVLIKPPLIDPVFNFTQIQIDHFRIKLPLIWEQFTLQVNGIRLKWIRKKKRFQLSIKIPKQFKGQVSVDQLPVNCDNVYTKYYFPIPVKKTEWHVSLNDDRGVRLQKPQAISNSLHVSGTALDVRGILHDTFNFKLENSKRNRQVIGQKPEMNPLFINKRLLKFDLTARRCQPFTGQIEDFDLFLKNFFNTPAARLIHQLMIWTFEHNDVDQLKRTFLDILGFIPKIIGTSPEKFNPTAETLNLLISLNAMEEVVGNYQNFKVMQRKNYSRAKYLWINKNQLKKNLINFYFMQKIEKI
ncbi:MAG: hypothetical protein J7L94_10610, partial [Caldisericaceae bacterium]|nr:hypothetical protein [Caldisericaceae bacterium]